MATPDHHPVPDGRVSSTRLDSYVDRYAARTRGMTASEIRALFSVASRPEVVSLAGGMPNISGLPLDVVGDAINDLVREFPMEYSVELKRLIDLEMEGSVG